MPDTNALKTFLRNNPFKRRLIVAGVTFFLLLVLLRLILSPGLAYGIRVWLENEGLDANIENIDINITGGTFSLHNAVGKKDGHPLFRIGLVEVNWHWTPLSDKTIEITRVTLDGLDVEIKQYSDVIIIGGVRIPLNQPDQRPAQERPPADDLAQPWAAALNEVSFHDLHVCYLQHHAAMDSSSGETLSMDYCVSVDEMTWRGTVSYARNRELLEKNELPVASSGDFSLNGLKVNDNRLHRYVLSSHANTLENVLVTGLNDIRIGRIDMQQLSALQRDDDRHRDAVRFSRFTVNSLRLYQMNTLDIGSVEISEPGLYIMKYATRDWEYQQWLPHFPAAENTGSSEADDDTSGRPSAFDISIGNIGIRGADWCYQDNSTKLYYCLTYDEMNWQGKLAYSTLPASANTVALDANGDFSLSEVLVLNRTIDRSLLRLKRLQLHDITLEGINRAQLMQLDLENLAALQRSKKDDDFTLGFETLKVHDSRYMNNSIQIDSISLEQLQTLVSRNSDGSWEYEKWLPEHLRPEQSSASGESSADNNAVTTAGAEPFIISLNRLEINTDRKLQYIDNTTQPPMQIGLQHLRFDLTRLNSGEPDRDTLIKLFARTLRHGTIELAGSIRPFAEKVSFDAKGKLKGFDLRAATPATRQSIGHIIKSGQMDADLKLLAVNGKLDSNISLSLYQFHIKALNKKDADELDKKFGMPLNKTLMLLRDKDDSIHLDIPITGDVSNPEFNPMDAVLKATTKAATVTLITFYTPYGLAYAGGNILFDLATALNFDPISFAPGSSALTADNRAQLDRLTKLLTEKPGVHLTLCGTSTMQDAYTLFPELKDAAAKAEKTDTQAEPETALPELTPAQYKKLEELARQRQVNSKNYLVREKGIEHDRLILCAPEHKQDSDAIAGVEIII